MYPVGEEGPLRLVEEDDHRRGQQEARNTETRGGGQRGHVSQVSPVDTEIKPGSPGTCENARGRLDKTLTCSFNQQEFQTFQQNALFYMDEVSILIQSVGDTGTSEKKVS